MKPALQFMFICLVITVLSFSISSCSSGGSEPLGNAVTLEAELNDGTLITSLTIEGSGTRIRAGETYKLKAVAIDLNGDVVDASNRVTWSSADTSIATVDASGLITAIANKTDAQGFVTITIETLSGVTATGNISINDADVLMLQVHQIVPAGNILYTCINTQYEAIVTYVDDVKHGITDRANWDVSGSNTASIDSSGLLHTSSGLVEQLMVTAEFYGISNQLTFSTDPSQLNTIFTYDQQQQINSLQLQVGDSKQLVVKASFDAGIGIDITDISNNSSWQVTNTKLLGVTNNGPLKGSLLALKSGATVLSATCSGESGFVTISINGTSEFDSLLINGGDETISIKPGESIDLQMLITYINTTTAVNLSEFTSWTIENTALLSGQLVLTGDVNSAFRLSANTDNLGETIITGTYDNETRTVTVNIVN